MSDSTFDFDKMVCFALYSTANAMVRNYARPLDAIGITYPQLLILAALWEQDDVSASMLSERTLYDLGTLSPIIKRLQHAGLVEVYLDPLDRRRHNVRLTPQGRAMKSTVAKIFTDTRCKINLTAEEITAVLSVCRKVKDRLAD